MAKLYQLLNGDYIDPNKITAIRYFPIDNSAKERVVVTTDLSGWYVIEFDQDQEAAKDYHKMLAYDINQLRG